MKINKSFSHRFEYDDERLLRLCHLIHKCFQVIDMTGGVLNLIPSIRYVAPSRSGFRPLLDAHRPLWAFLRQTIAEKRQQSAGESNSFVQLYLTELDKKRVGNTAVHGSFSGETAVCLVAHIECSKRVACVYVLVAYCSFRRATAVDLPGLLPSRHGNHQQYAELRANVYDAQ